VGTVLGAALLLGIVWAFAVGGQQTVARFASLTADNPTDVYTQNRGFFLQELIFTDIPRYPLGAGLGRWGMMNYYFGTHDSADQLYSEIMWTGWIFDGGVPLMVVYLAGMLCALWVAWRLAGSRHPMLGLWAAVVFSYDVAALAGTFVFPLFVVQGGLEFWLINACLYSAYLALRSGAGADHSSLSDGT